MKISVVIATYNGEKYFAEQMDSILEQSRIPDEIIIVDDCSADGTCALLENYSSGNESIHVFNNTRNQGWKKNFHHAIEKASGDIIVLCDQDDIWYKDKLARVEAVFLQQNKVKLLASDFDELISGKIRKKKRDKPLLRPVPLNSKLIHTYYPGCTYAFRRSLYETIKVIWNDDLPHDAQLGIAAKLMDSMYIYGIPLTVYRRHDNNATKRTLPSKQKKEGYIAAERGYVQFADRLLDIARDEIVDLDKKKAIITATAEYINRREQLLKKATPETMIKGLQSVRCYYSPKTFIGDVFFGMKNK